MDFSFIYWFCGQEMIQQGRANYETAAAADAGIQPDWNAMSVTNTNGITIGGRDVCQQGYPTVHHVEVRGCTIGNCPGVGVFAAAWMTALPGAKKRG